MSDPAETDKEAIMRQARAIAAKLAYAMSMAFYVGESGTVAQHGPGERIEPAKSPYGPVSGYGSGTPAAAAQP